MHLSFDATDQDDASPSTLRNRDGLMVAWRKLAARGAALVGYEAFPRYLAEGRPHAIRLRNLFARCGIERVLDIGANKGQFRDFLRIDVEYSGAIHSFEPDPALADILTNRAASDKAWRISPVALGAKNESRLFSRMIQTP